MDPNKKIVRKERYNAFFFVSSSWKMETREKTFNIFNSQMKLGLLLPMRLAVYDVPIAL